MSESLDVPKTQLVSHDSFPIRIEIHARSSHGSSDGHGLPVVGSPMLAAWAMLAHSGTEQKPTSTVVHPWKMNILTLRILPERNFGKSSEAIHHFQVEKLLIFGGVSSASLIYFTAFCISKCLESNKT